MDFLGDVIPSRSDYILVVGFLLLVGLALISTLITIIQKQIEALATVSPRTDLLCIFLLRA